MDKRVTEYFQRRPLEVKAWRYVDPLDRNLPDWMIAAINRWPEQGGIYFNDLGTLEIKCGLILSMPLGYWLLEEKDGTLRTYSNDDFHRIYQPSPIKMREDHAKQINGSREQ